MKIHILNGIDSLNVYGSRLPWQTNVKEPFVCSSDKNSTWTYENGPSTARFTSVLSVSGAGLFRHIWSLLSSQGQDGKPQSESTQQDLLHIDTQPARLQTSETFEFVKLSQSTMVGMWCTSEAGWGTCASWGGGGGGEWACNPTTAPVLGGLCRALFWCARSPASWEYALWQTWHLYGRSPVWRRTWLRRVEDWLKRRLQKRHTKGLSSVWMRMWERRLLRELKPRWQMTQRMRLAAERLAAETLSHRLNSSVRRRVKGLNTWYRC